MSTSPLLWAVVYGGVLLSVLKAQQIQVSPKVWGYVGQEEVTLPCHFNYGTVVQGEWTIQTPDEESIKVVVFNVDPVSTNNIHIHDKYVDKVYLKEYSLVIKNVDMADAGEYTCTLTTFPSGSFSDKTQLIVNEQMPLSAGVVSAIVISVILLLGIIAATVYFILFKRCSCSSSSGNHVSVDTQSWVRDPSRPSILKREDMRTEVVYADVEVQRSSRKRVNSADDLVTYSEVKFTRNRPDEAVLYSQVMHI